MAKPEPIFGPGLGEIISSVGVLGIFGAIGLVGYQCFIWLKTGVWRSYELRTLWESKPVAVDWAGLRLMAEWFAGMPLSVGLFLGGLAIALLGVVMAARLNRPGAD